MREGSPLAQSHSVDGRSCVVSDVQRPSLWPYLFLGVSWGDALSTQCSNRWSLGPQAAQSPRESDDSSRQISLSHQCRDFLARTVLGTPEADPWDQSSRSSSSKDGDFNADQAAVSTWPFHSFRPLWGSSLPCLLAWRRGRAAPSLCGCRCALWFLVESQPHNWCTPNGSASSSWTDCSAHRLSNS